MNIYRLPSKVWDFLDGRKTIIGATLVFISGGLLAIKRIDEETAKVVITLGEAIALFGIRAALQKLSSKR